MPNNPSLREVLATYPSQSSSTIYEIRRGGDGVVFCTCPSWRMKQGKRSCKHLDQWRRTNFHRPLEGKRETFSAAQLWAGDIVEVHSRDDVFLLKVERISPNSGGPNNCIVYGTELLDAGEAPCSADGKREVPFEYVTRIVSKAR